MNETPQQSQSVAELGELDILRVETAVSRYPIHQLAKKGTISINIRKHDERGGTVLLWEVTYNSKYGQPGPLAYKLDTIIINRKIDEAREQTRTIPKIIRLGSLSEIARELGTGDNNTQAVKKAFFQNAFAALNVKGLRYRTQDKNEQTFEFGDTRYGVVFTGERLPDGRKADAVFIVFHDLYLGLLNSAIRRPLDYDYLRDLPPGPQRFYEIVSYEMLPAIKFNQRAKLPYSEFCMYSTMTRYEHFEQVKKQMYKIHLPHIRAGYIAKVQYEATVDAEGRPDWNMFYVPGEIAKHQQLVFDLGGRFIKRERIKTPPAPKQQKQSAAAAAPMQQLPLLPISSDDAKAKELVLKFYKLRYGHSQEPTDREISEATAYVIDGEGWGEYLIEHAAKQGKEGGGFPNDFGGVKKLVGQVREGYETKRKEQAALMLRKARQSHEEGHRAAYRAFLGELLRGTLASSLPEAYAAFASQEAKTHEFHQARSQTSKTSAKIVSDFYTEDNRVNRLIKFIQDHPKSGIPSFWQWDEKMNTNPFLHSAPRSDAKHTEATRKDIRKDSEILSRRVKENPERPETETLPGSSETDEDPETVRALITNSLKDMDDSVE